MRETTARLQRPVAAVILAAGKGTRMKSGLSKLVHDIMGQPIVNYVAEACRQAGIDRLIAVVGHDAGSVKAALGTGIEYLEQHEQLGTGHALMMAAPVLREHTGELFVLVGDAPFITADILKALLAKHRAGEQAATFLTAQFDQIPPYGRIVRASNGHVVAIVEEVDCTPEQLQIKEVNSSHYCFRAEVVLPLLQEINPDNRKSEYLLTDIVAILNRHGHHVETFTATDNRVARGINDRRDLVAAIALMREQVVEKMLSRGVTIIDPATTFIDSTVTIGQDTIVYPNTYLAAGTVVGERCQIGPFVELRQTTVGDGARLSFVAAQNTDIPPAACPAPFQNFESVTSR